MIAEGILGVGINWIIDSVIDDVSKRQHVHFMKELVIYGYRQEEIFP